MRLLPWNSMPLSNNWLQLQQGMRFAESAVAIGSDSQYQAEQASQEAQLCNIQALLYAIELLHEQDALQGIK